MQGYQEETFRRDYMAVGRNIFSNKTALDQFIEGFNFIPVYREDGTPVTFDQIPGIVMKEILEKFEISHPIAMAYQQLDNGVKCYGIKARFTNGTVKFYIVDGDYIVTPIAADFYPRVTERTH